MPSLGTKPAVGYSRMANRPGCNILDAKSNTGYALRRCGRLDGAAAGSYALVHAGRQWRLGPIAFWIVIGVLVIMAGWTITTATYFGLPRRLTDPAPARHAEMQFGL